MKDDNDHDSVLDKITIACGIGTIEHYSWHILETAPWEILILSWNKNKREVDNSKEVNCYHVMSWS